MIDRDNQTRMSESKTKHTQKACRNQLVALGQANLLKPVVTGPRKSSGYSSAQLSDSDWEADVLPLSYTRKSGSDALLGSAGNKSEATAILS
jgi:hypothetical protein